MRDKTTKYEEKENLKTLWGQIEKCENRHEEKYYCTHTTEQPAKRQFKLFFENKLKEKIENNEMNE